MAIAKTRGQPISLRSHLKHHGRFYASAALGIMVWVLAASFGQFRQFALAGDAFFSAYLVSTIAILRHLTPGQMRKRAAWGDEGIGVYCVYRSYRDRTQSGIDFSLLNEPKHARSFSARAFFAQRATWLDHAAYNHGVSLRPYLLCQSCRRTVKRTMAALLFQTPDERAHGSFFTTPLWLA